MYESTAKYVCRVKEKVHLVFFFKKKYIVKLLVEREFWNSKSTASQVAMQEEDSKKADAKISKSPFLGIICRLIGANRLLELIFML